MKLLALLSLLIASSAFAIEADYTHFYVDGKDYVTPIPNKETRDDFYMLHKALDGDEYAREILLGNLKERFFYIGDTDGVRWLILRENDVEVTEHKLGS